MKKKKELFYDWNRKLVNHQKIEFHDETLRDGLQASYVRNPTIDQKVVLLRLMEDLKIHSANIGFPGAGARHKEDVVALAKIKRENRLNIKLTCASRTYIEDIIPIIEASQSSGVAIEAGIFLGSSEIRRLVEKWSLKEMGKMVRDSVSFAVKNNLPVMFVTEDTTRAHPSTLRYLYNIAIDKGAKRICIADTVGYATPKSTENIVRFFVEKIVKDSEVNLDWHAHRDRNLEIANCLTAIEAGVNRIHGTALGVGERSGNVPIDLLLVNLRVEGIVKNNLTTLPEYVRYASVVLGVPVPVNYPVIGDEAYTTGSGIHAAAQLKAEELGRDDLVARVYSGVDPRIVGRMPEVEVGSMSGKANVILKLRQMKIKPTRNLVKKILETAKASNNILSNEEIRAVLTRVKTK